jgi:hypothetical protein
VIIVEPGDTVDTIPLVPIMATVVVEDDHVPPLTLLVKVPVLPLHNVVMPVIVPAVGAFTVTVFVAVAAPQAFVTA